MLEQILALLTSLVVAAAGAVGVQTASEAPHGVGTPEIAAARAEAAREAAAERLAAALEGALAAIEQAQSEVEPQDASTGLDTAATAITESPAWEASGGEANDGLTIALEAVTSAPTGGGDEADTAGGEPPEDVPPVTTPAGPPSDVPSGASDAPGGRP